MLKDLLSSPSVPEVVFRTIVVYLFVLIGIRLAGKREVGQMTPFDLVLVLLLSNSVQNAMVGPDNTLAGGLIAAATLLLLNTAIGKLAVRNHFIRGIIRGHPRMLVHRGVVVAKNLEAEGIRHQDLMQALREHGVLSIEDVRLAVMEIDGTISVLKYDDISEDVEKPHRRFRYRKMS